MYEADTRAQYICHDRERVASVIASTRVWLGAIPSSARVMDLGCGTGELAEVHDGWTGVDISVVGCSAARERTQRPVCTADLVSLPIATESVDAVISWATLEHVPEPDRAIAEIERVLRPGGIAIIAPAWHCRSWTVRRLPFRAYSDLTWPERLSKFLIPLREHLLWRMAAVVPTRLWREAASYVMVLGFPYHRLHPFWDSTLPHVPDDDAACDIDPHALISMWRSKQWRILSHPRLLDRLLCRSGAVVAIKPARGAIRGSAEKPA